MLTPDFVAKVQSGSPVAPGGAPGTPQDLSDDTSYNAWKGSLSTPAPQGGDSGIGGVVKSIVSAPATIIARPFQAAADLGDYLGTKIEADRATNQGQKAAILGADQQRETQNQTTTSGPAGLVAPAPANAADVKKDIGRGVQTVALGMGPVSGGAAFGAGNSLAQGNDLLSPETAVQTVLGAFAGKTLDLAGKPILDAAGKAVAKITPQFLHDVAVRGTQAITDLANHYKILPDAVSHAINSGAATAEKVANKPFDAAAGAAKSVADTITPTISAARQSRIVNNRVGELSKLESGNSVIRKSIATAKGKGIDVKNIVANTDLLHNSVDNNGTIRTTQPGGAVEQLTHFIQPQEDVISKTLQREGKTIPFSDLQKQLTSAVDNSAAKGGAKIRAQQNVAQDIKGYMLDAVDSKGKPWVEGQSTGEPQIPLATVHDAKVDKYSNIDYSNPESQKTDKVIAKTLKRVVENNTDSVDAKKLNAELGQHYATLNFLEKLDGRKVEGGRLGKYFAQTVGGMVGSHFGPLGTIAGAEAGGLIKGGIMKSKFGSPIGKNLEQSPAMKEAIQANEAHSNSAGSRNASQSTTNTNTSSSIEPTVPQKSLADKAKGVIKTIKTEGNKGFIKVPGGAPKIPADDLAVMSDFTDYHAGSYKPSTAEVQKLELDASRIWEKYFPNKPMPKDNEAMAHAFGKHLEKVGFGK